MLFETAKINVNSFTYRNKYFDKYTTPEILDESCKFQFLPTDIITATFQRSGTTFTQEIIWQIKNRKSTKRGEKVDSLMIRMPFLEFNYKIFPGLATAFELMETQKNDPHRFIKTHLPFEFIKDNFEKVNPKMVVSMRNVKDCLVSNFFLESNFPVSTFKGTFDEYFNLFVNGQVDYGSYFDNNLEWWSLRNRENVLIVFYEDVLMNLPHNVEKIANFLGEKLTDDELDKIVYNCSFSTMYDNPKVNYRYNDSFTFLRKGIVGDWKNHLKEEQNKILDEMIESRLEKVGLKFIYE